jgi:hypothetical protein
MGSSKCQQEDSPDYIYREEQEPNQFSVEVVQALWRCVRGHDGNDKSRGR